MPGRRHLGRYAQTQFSVCPTTIPLQLSVGALQLEPSLHGEQLIRFASTQDGGAGLQAEASSMGPPQQ